MRTVSLVVAALLTSGCATFSALEAGPAYAVGKPEESAAALDLSAGVGVGDRSASLGVGSALRAKIGPKVGQVALSPFIYGTYGSAVAGFVKLGFDLIEFESLRDTLAVGAFGPHAAVGILLPISRTLGITVAFDTSYVVRLTDAPNTGYLAVLVGIGEIREEDVITHGLVRPSR